jgi:hypothetical protein
MNTFDYLNNPVVEPGFYLAKCVEVQTLNGMFLPVTMLKFRIIPSERYGDAQDQFLCVTLRDAPNAKHLHEKFQDAFQVVRSPAEAMNRFGSILVDDAEYEGKRYSAVHFVKQSALARQQARRLEIADREGEIPWGEPAPFAA